jgi:Flp pilus assembly secretin CpaC
MNSIRFQTLTATLLFAVGAAAALASDNVVIQTPARTQVQLTAGQQQLLRSRFKVVRTAVSDSSVCAVNQFSTSELAIVARSPGTAEVTVWFAQPDQEPRTYLIEVR